MKKGFRDGWKATPQQRTLLISEIDKAIVVPYDCNNHTCHYLFEYITGQYET